MSTVNLYVAGINNLSNPAGKIAGAEFSASSTGPTADRVWYRVDANPLVEAAFGKDVHDAYLGADERRRLEQLAAVSYRTEDEVRGAGMSNYILWLAPS